MFNTLKWQLMDATSRRLWLMENPQYMYGCFGDGGDSGSDGGGGGGDDDGGFDYGGMAGDEGPDDGGPGNVGAYGGGNDGGDGGGDDHTGDQVVSYDDGTTVTFDVSRQEAIESIRDDAIDRSTATGGGFASALVDTIGDTMSSSMEISDFNDAFPDYAVGLETAPDQMYGPSPGAQISVLGPAYNDLTASTTAMTDTGFVDTQLATQSALAGAGEFGLLGRTGSLGRMATTEREFRNISVVDVASTAGSIANTVTGLTLGSLVAPPVANALGGLAQTAVQSQITGVPIDAETTIANAMSSVAGGFIGPAFGQEVAKATYGATGSIPGTVAAYAVADLGARNLADVAAQRIASEVVSTGPLADSFTVTQPTVTGFGPSPGRLQAQYGSPLGPVDLGVSDDTGLTVPTPLSRPDDDDDGVPTPRSRPNDASTRSTDPVDISVSLPQPRPNDALAPPTQTESVAMPRARPVDVATPRARPDDEPVRTDEVPTPRARPTITLSQARARELSGQLRDAAKGISQPVSGLGPTPQRATQVAPERATPVNPDLAAVVGAYTATTTRSPEVASSAGTYDVAIDRNLSDLMQNIAQPVTLSAPTPRARPSDIDPTAPTPVARPSDLPTPSTPTPRARPSDLPTPSTPTPRARPDDAPTSSTPIPRSRPPGLVGLIDASKGRPPIGDYLNVIDAIANKIGGYTELSGQKQAKAYNEAIDDLMKAYPEFTEEEIMDMITKGKRYASGGTVNRTDRNSMNPRDLMRRTNDILVDVQLAQKFGMPVDSLTMTKLLKNRITGEGDDPLYFIKEGLTASERERMSRDLVTLKTIGDNIKSPEMKKALGGVIQKKMAEGGAVQSPTMVGQPETNETLSPDNVADDVPMNGEDGGFVINAPAVAQAGKMYIQELITEAVDSLRAKGNRVATKSGEKVDEETIPLLVSEGEVYLPPEIAEEIGISRLEKINNRGKKKVAKLQKKAEEEEAPREGFVAAPA